NAASQHHPPVRPAPGATGVILLKAVAEGQPAVALWDTGAEGNFVNWHFIERHKLQHTMKRSSQRVKYADGTVREARGEATISLRLLTHGQPHCSTLRVIVADLQPRFDVILGTPFCKEHLPRPDWHAMTI